MAFIETIPPEMADPELQQMYERQQAKYGYLPNYAKVFCYRPELMGLWANLLAGIRRNIEPRRFLLVTFAAANALHSQACSRAYGKMLREYFTPEEIAAIADGDASAPLTPAEQAMLSLARKVAIDATTVTAADIDALRQQGFADNEIFDIVAAVAGRSFFTKILDGLGVTLDTKTA